MENLELIPLICGGKVDFCSAEVDDLWCIQLVDGDYKWKIVLKKWHGIVGKPSTKG
jgi:hypothetical protein